MPDGTCTSAGCQRAVHVKKWQLCNRHYQRMMQGLPPEKPTAEDRFFMYVHRAESGCWEWTGTLHTGGYARFYAEGVLGYGHRWSYEHFTGKAIPDGFDIDHLCRVRKCVNPNHLEPVTRHENLMRSPIVPTAINSRKTHCPQGHGYTPENTRLNKRGERVCINCARASSRRIAARKRQERAGAA